MYSKKITRSITLATILVSAFATSMAFAGSDKQSGKRRGPPPEAIEVCAEQTEGDACAFTGRRGDVTGTCIVRPRGEEILACAPEGGPPKDRHEKEVQE